MAPKCRDPWLSSDTIFSTWSIDSSLSVLPYLLKGFLSNFYQVIEPYGNDDDDNDDADDDDDDDDYEFRFNDVLIHEGHLRQNVI